MVPCVGGQLGLALPRLYERLWVGRVSLRICVGPLGLTRLLRHGLLSLPSFLRFGML